MVRDLNINKREELKSDLKNLYPELTNTELEKVNATFDQLVEAVSLKTHQNKDEVEKLLVDRLDFINSKHLI